MGAQEAQCVDHKCVDPFLPVERSFCAGTRAGMAHAHLLMTWFNVSGTRQISPRSPPALKIPEARAKNAKFCLEKRAKRLITLKRFPIRFPKDEKPRFLF